MNVVILQIKNDVLNSNIIISCVRCYIWYIVYVLIHYYRRRYIQNEIKKFEGEWKSFPIGKHHLPNENVLLGIIKVEVFKNNILTFRHENKIEGRKGVDWEGKLIINKEYHQTGRMIWHYMETSPYTDIGFKEVVLKEKSDCFLLYLIPVNFGNQKYEFGVWKKMKKEYLI